jgi:hypothetical protein
MRNDLRSLMKTAGDLAGSIWELVADGALRWAYAIARYEAVFEELAIIRNSRLINDRATLYMFGYWAILCNKSDNLWHGLNRE